ncbi:hypothetical protein EZJ28_09875 [Gramella sp. KN1008]|nr:hypothetical protein EZJ28_09875 [Gramella sp. KN1008]
MGVVFWLTSSTAIAQKLNLQVSGDEQNGYSVNVLNGEELLLSSEGEFTLSLSNLDLSVQQELRDFRAASFKNTATGISLYKDIYLEQYDSNLSVEVNYEQLSSNLIKKTVRLFQPSIPALYYTLRLKNTPANTPERYITFEHEDFPGGLVHELYPSAGFITSQGNVVGFLTDPGYKNHFTRTTRRRFSGRGGGMIGMRVLPDARLLSIASPEEQISGEDYIQYTFGSMDVLDRGSVKELDLPDTFNKVGNIELERKDSIIELKFKDNNKAGIELLTSMRDQRVYTVSFLAKANSPLSLKLFRMKNGKRTKELEHGIKYIDNFPVNTEEWTLFKGSVLVPYIEKDSIKMFIGANNPENGTLQLKNLKIEENHPFERSYNKLTLGEPVEKVTYIFSEPWKDQKQFKISTKTRLAEGMGFQGTEIEKMLYANFQMMTWITSVDDFTAFNVPNMNYSPDMYNRDSFWSVISTYNRELNVSIWNQWAKTQTSRGTIGTIITPYMGSVEAKDNEATIEWLIWGLLNKRRFGVELPEDKIKLAADYILNEFDEDGDAVCASHFSMSQIDVMEYHPKTKRMAANQGMFTVALKTIKALGVEISEDYIAKAEKEYSNFYDPERKHLLFDTDYPDLISFTDLIPEFLSLWVFDEPMLTDEMVKNHLDQIPALNKTNKAPYPEIGTTSPICIRLTDDAPGYTYMDENYQPFGEFGKNNYGDHARDGYYYNGGSWLRAEYTAYVTGLKHGWEKAEKRMENRLWAEINLNPNWPYSKEFIPTKWNNYEEWWDSTRGLSWNVFVLMANEFAGLRSPAMDPDYEKKEF